MPPRLHAFSTSHIQKAVAIGSLLLIALLWLVAITELRAEERRTIEAAIRENQNRAAAFEQYLARTLETADLAAIHVAELYGHHLPLVESASRPALLVDQVAKNPIFAGVVVADSKGDVITTTFPDAPALNIESSITFRRFRDNPRDQGPVISRPANSPFSDRPLIAISRPIRSSGGRFGGIVIVQIVAERLVDFNRGATTRPSDLISVIRSDGVSLARRQSQALSFGEDLRGARVMREQAVNPHGTYLGASALDGIRRFFSHRRLEDYGVFVTVGVGEGDVVADVKDRTRFAVAGLGALTFLVLALAFSTVVGFRRREAAARDLAVANLRLSEAQRIARIGDWEYDPKTEGIHLSDELCDMYGLPRMPGERDQAEIARFFPAQQQAIWLDAIERALADRVPQECEVEAELASGPSYRRIRIVPRLAADGSVEKIVGTDQDISREKEHRRLRDQVAHSSRVEVMNAIAATVAHELAQPLTAASNYLASAKMAVERRPPGFETRLDETLEQVGRQIDVTRTIVRRVWEMVANRRSSVQRASLAEAVQDAIGLVKIANEHPHVRIVQRLGRDARFVRADKIQIQQVLTNLIRNAVEAASGSEAARVMVTSRLERDMVEICVADSGPGIDAEGRDIFSPFATTKGGGLGLGLSISRMIVDSFDGKIWADQTAGEGARICISLPAAEAER
jgi:signal transduction histidine kinase